MNDSAIGQLLDGRSEVASVGRLGPTIRSMSTQGLRARYADGRARQRWIEAMMRSVNDDTVICTSR